MTNNDLADRLLLEHQYDRPSLHCENWSHRVIGSICAILEQHIDTAHPERRSEWFTWEDMHCNLCDFDGRAELHRLYPELQEESP